MIERPTVINGVDVINADGTLALQVDGWDVLYLNLSRGYSKKAPELTREQHQKIIDVIVTALMGKEDSHGA